MPPQNQNTPAETTKKGGTMTYWVLAGIVIIAAAVGYMYWGPGMTSEQSGDTTSLESPPPPPPPPPPPGGGTGTEEMTAEDGVTVSYTSDGYTPKEVAITAGQSVTFVNNSNIDMWPASAQHPTHTMYDGTTLEAHCAEGATPSFDACDSVAPGESYTFVFSKAGTWRYHDHLTSGRTGSVVVQ